ncbi:hypothetical protein PIB30_025732 [Stylosanthes scabra]|uniref:Uncharacterized protein n=1 Tax=Stylosanthes scabra TaxID=79078 RepID=A0ABU6QBI1_9FABA|nr:hypothetical protein [Stylosanthes scabra]
MRTQQLLEEKNLHSYTDAYAFTLCVRIRVLTTRKREGSLKGPHSHSLSHTHSHRFPPSLFIRPFQMVRTRSASLAKGKTKLCQPPTRASPRLAALRSNTAVQILTPTPDVPVKEAVTSTLSPKKRQNFRMAGESSSRRDTRTPCKWSRRLAALYSVTKPVSEEKVVIKISNDSVQKRDTNLEQNEAEPVAKVGGRVDLLKNDVYDALWAILDAESDNEAAEMPREWDLDNTLLNWGRNEPDVGPVGPNQGPPPAGF